MNQPSANRASQFFNVYAHDFNAIYGNKHTLFNRLINNLFRKAMRVRYQKTLEGCQPLEGRSVLDVGRGPGHYSVALAKAGAAKVYGVDFAQGMIEIARRNADAAGIGARCTFDYGDFLTQSIPETYDYAVVMGFMDYIEDPATLIKKVLSVTGRKAFFSFPVDGGILAWQRKQRYKSRCELYMYERPQLEKLFAGITKKPVTIEQIGRDFFVTVNVG